MRFIVLIVTLLTSHPSLGIELIIDGKIHEIRGYEIKNNGRTIIIKDSLQTDLQKQACHKSIKKTRKPASITGTTYKRAKQNHRGL